MVSEIQLRERLAQFLAAPASREEFEDWFVQNSWNIHRSGDLMAQRLAYAIELRLAENDSGHLPDAELLDELKSLLISMVRFPASPGEPIITSGSSDVAIPQAWEAVTVDTQLAAASALSARR